LAFRISISAVSGELGDARLAAARVTRRTRFAIDGVAGEGPACAASGRLPIRFTVRPAAVGRRSPERAGRFAVDPYGFRAAQPTRPPPGGDVPA
jgi:hypothetical protein